MDDTFTDIMSESIETFIDLDNGLAPLFEQKILSTVSSYDNISTIQEGLDVMEDFCLYVENMASIVQESNKDVDDLEKNLDKFLKGNENILFIIGNAGSGKSTLAKYYEGTIPNCIDVELDRLYETIVSRGVKTLPDTDAFKIFKGWEKFMTDDANFEEVFRKAFNIGRRAAERDKEHKYIFTGIQTQNLYNANYLGSYPIIIKGTGKKNSVKRKFNRIKQDYENADSPTTKVDAAIVSAGKQLKYMSKKGSLGDKVGSKLEKVPNSNPKMRAAINLAARDAAQTLTKNKVNGTIRSNDKRMDKLRKTLDDQSKNNPEYGQLKKLGVERGGEEVDSKTGEKKVPKYVKEKLKNQSEDRFTKSEEEKKAEREKAVREERDKLSRNMKKVNSFTDSEEGRQLIKDVKNLKDSVRAEHEKNKASAGDAMLKWKNEHKNDTNAKDKANEDKSKPVKKEETKEAFIDLTIDDDFF